MTGYRVGLDIGGTFTDCLLLDEQTGQCEVLKVPSTPGQVADAPRNALMAAIGGTALAGKEPRFVAHGCTVGTNTIIERTGARTGLITTRGFRDVLELGRVARSADLLYDVRHTRATPLVSRELRLEVDERLDYRGEIVRSLNVDSVAEAAIALKKAGVESVAVCLLFSHINPAHEQRVAEYLRATQPSWHVSVSSEIAPTYGEYERTSTTAINAYIGPVFEAYLELLDKYIAENLRSDLFVMQSNGGMLPTSDARAAPARVLESGPTAGVVATAYLASEIGLHNVISFDMGGTTAKAGLISNGEPVEAIEYEVGATIAVPGAGQVHGRGSGFPLALPAVQVTEVGSGGGSIAWIDAAGGFHVGPRSAGSSPGPACYGLGGSEPTITDAQLMLGVLDPLRFLGGTMPLFPRLAEDAFNQRIGKRLGIGAPEAAHGAVRVANAKMAQAIRLVSVDQGHDPREFALMAFGGAGPMHACDVADYVEIPWVVIPLYPGLHSALGLVVSDVVHDQVRAFTSRADDFHALHRVFKDLEGVGAGHLTMERFAKDHQRMVRMADLRYRGQTHTVTVPVASGTIDGQAVRRLYSDFHARHDALYTFSQPDDLVEIVNLRLRAIGVVDRPAPIVSAWERPDRVETGHRMVWFQGTTSPTTAAVYNRSTLRAGVRITGPAVVEQYDATTVVPPGWILTVDAASNLIIGRREWQGQWAE